MMYSLNFGIKAISIFTSLIIVSCAQRESFTIVENVGENDNLSIKNIITWDDTPYWVDSINHYSLAKLDSFDLEQFTINSTRWINFKESLLKSNQIDGVVLILNNKNLMEIEMDISNNTLTHRLDTISRWEIEKFKKAFPNSYNWRNFYRDGYESRLNFKIDSIHDVIAFKMGNREKIIIHLVNGKPRTLRVILEKSS